MASLLQRLLGVPDAKASLEEAKAVTGAGVYALMNDVPLWHARKNPRQLIRQAQQLYFDNPWVALAERTVTGKVASVPWHLENKAGDTVQNDRWQQLFEKPQANIDPKQRQRTVDTRSKLWRLTSRHVGLCGSGFWLKDQVDLNGIPDAILYLNPARMIPVPDDNGNLIRWGYLVKDEEIYGEKAAIPLELDDVLHFMFEPPDEGFYGIGIVQSAGLKAQLAVLADRHAAQTVGSGGRLAGIFSPKQGTQWGDTEYTSLIRDLRNVTELPDATKRSLVLKAPVDFVPTASKPTDIDLTGLRKSAQEEILALWQVPPEVLGIPGPAGLNSGEKGKYMEAALWQNAVHPRLEPMRETIQFGLLDLDPTQPQLVIEEPAFDDEAPRYEVAQKAFASIPMTNDERRALVGFDPLDEGIIGPDGKPLGQSVWVPATWTQIDGEQEPEPVPMPLGAQVPPEEPSETVDDTAGEVDEVKAKRPEKIYAGYEGTKAKQPLLGLRRKEEMRLTPILRRTVNEILAQQKSEVVKRVRGATTRQLKDATYLLPRKWDGQLLAALRPHYVATTVRVRDAVASSLKTAGKADFDDIESNILRRAAERVSGINETTREQIACLIANGVAEGLSPAELGDVIEQATSFDEARAEMIARTETMLAYNDAALHSFREYGANMVEAIDGDDDAQCAERNGKVYPIDEALSITDHPNGTLDWAPVI